MKKLLILSLFIVSFVFIPGFSSGFASDSKDDLGIHLSMTTKKLSNGLNVILVEDHTVPIISYQTWYRVGSVDEHPGITGISHLFEHLMFKGTPKYGPKQFFLQLEARGADVNAYTTRDYTVYHETFVKPLLEKVIDMESDRMANLKLDSETINSERMVVLEERKLRTENTPDGKMQEAIWALAFKRHPYSWPVIGYPQDLLGLNLDQIVEYYKAHYQPANAAVVIVGDFKTDDVLKLMKKYYEPLEQRPRPKRDISDEPDQNEERRLTLYDEVASQRFMQAYHVPSAKDDDSYALDVLSNILFEGTSSRAYRRLVDEKDIVIGISGSNFTPTYPGLFMINGVMKGDLDSSVAEQALDEVIHEVQDKGVTQDEITAAVKQLTVQLVDSIRTPDGMAQLIGTVQTIFGDPELYADDLKRYVKISLADVKRVANKYMVPNNRSVVILKPEVQPESSPTQKSKKKKSKGL
jgi:zinc protease